METNEYAIQIDGLRKSFDTQEVLKGIDLRLAQGEILAVLGRSGTGKSVLLKLIIGLLKPDSGKIRIQDQEITSLTVEELNAVRKKIGFLFQYAALYDSLTVEENIAFPLLWHGDLSDQQRRERVQQLLSRIDMEDARQKLPSQLSGGMKKRVGLARAMALDPAIMLLDEPTAGLDPVTATEINTLFCDLQKEKHISAILVTHDMHTVKTTSNHVVMLHEGKILYDGTYEGLGKSQDPQVSEFIQLTV